MFNNQVIIIVVSGLAILLLAFAITAYLIVKKKNSKSIVNEPFIAALKLSLGGIDNVEKTEVEQGRLRITVNDLDLVKLEDLKVLTETGVFVTGNTIKVLFKEDSELVKKALEK